jgi:hypothetical protein
MKKILTSVLVTAVLVGGGAFYGGMKYAQSKMPRRIGQGDFGNFQQMGAANIGGLRGNRSGGFAVGEVIAKDKNSVTIKLNNGGSKIVFYSDATEVGKFTKGTADDLQVGESVTVSGDANQDGSITAKLIQIRPAVPVPTGQ